MNRFYFWLFLQLALSSPIVFAQDSDTALNANSTILSASSSEQNEWGSFSVSIGFMQNNLSVAVPNDTIPGTMLRDTAKSSKALTDKVLYSALRGDASSVQGPSGNPHEIAAAISVYPNPFVDHLTLFLGESTMETGNDLRYTLFDITGNSIQTGPLEHGKKEIAMSSMTKGVYFLVLFQNGEEIKSFKLLKNNL